MKKYYCVVSTFNDNGSVSSNIVDCITADEKPQNSFRSGRRADYYADWFDSFEEAKQYVKETLMA